MKRALFDSTSVGTNFQTGVAIVFFMSGWRVNGGIVSGERDFPHQGGGYLEKVLHSAPLMCQNCERRAPSLEG